MQSVWSRFELVSPCPIPTTITITPRAPPKIITNSLQAHYTRHPFKNAFFKNLLWLIWKAGLALLTVLAFTRLIFSRRPGTEYRSSGPLANTLTIRTVSIAVSKDSQNAASFFNTISMRNNVFSTYPYGDLIRI